MSTFTATPPSIYHMSPRRRWLLLGMGGLLILGPGAMIVIGSVIGDNALVAVGIIFSLMMSPLAIFLFWMGNFPRLTVSPQGIVARGVVGFSTVEVPWDGIEKLLMRPNKQALVLRVPLNTKAAKRLSRWRHMTYRGVPMYDDEQKQYIAEERYVQIAVFYYWFKHGELLNEIRAYAPRLGEQYDAQQGEFAEMKKKEAKEWLIAAGIVAAIIAAMIAFGLFEN
jgi:hypothetical protein